MSVADDLLTGLVASGISLRGADGTQGDQGLKGDTGSKGDKGDKGDRGPAGKDGTDGKAGKDGLKGDTGPVGPDEKVKIDRDDSKAGFLSDKLEAGRGISLRKARTGSALIIDAEPTFIGGVGTGPPGPPGPPGPGGGDQTAAEVPFTPAGGIAATNVQGAIVEAVADAQAALAAKPPFSPVSYRLFAPGADVVFSNVGHGNRVSSIFEAQEFEGTFYVWLDSQPTGTAGPTNSLGVVRLLTDSYHYIPFALGWNGPITIPAGTRWYIYTYTGGAFDPGVTIAGHVAPVGGALAALPLPDGIVSGFGVTGAGGSETTYVPNNSPMFFIGSGIARINSYQSLPTQIPGNTVIAGAGHATYSRIDTAVVVSPGIFGPAPGFDTATIGGVASASPVPPAVPAGHLPLFDIIVPPNATDSSQCTISTDRRVFVQSDSYTIAAYVPDPATPEQIRDALIAAGLMAAA